MAILRRDEFWMLRNAVGRGERLDGWNGDIVKLLAERDAHVHEIAALRTLLELKEPRP